MSSCCGSHCVLTCSDREARVIYVLSWSLLLLKLLSTLKSRQVVGLIRRLSSVVWQSESPDCFVVLQSGEVSQSSGRRAGRVADRQELEFEARLTAIRLQIPSLLLLLFCSELAGWPARSLARSFVCFDWLVGRSALSTTRR